MARPERNNVDYFPFYCEEGNKMFYIEETYGNDGFATFIKLLRELAKTNYHYLDLSKPTTVMFLSAKCKVSKEILLSIVNDLVEIGKFDSMLWKENKIIWCQSFIESISDAYFKRKNTCITYEGLLILLLGLGVRKPSKLQTTVSINTQSKEKEIILEEIKEKETKENKILFEKEPKKIDDKVSKFNFKKELINYGFNEILVDDWLAVRKTKKATNTHTAFDSFIKEIESRTCNINEMLQICVTNSWSGFKFTWVDNLNSTKNGSKNQPGKTNAEIYQDAVNSDTGKSFNWGK